MENSESELHTSKNSHDSTLEDVEDFYDESQRTKLLFNENDSNNTNNILGIRIRNNELINIDESSKLKNVSFVKDELKKFNSSSNNHRQINNFEDSNNQSSKVIEKIKFFTTFNGVNENYNNDSEFNSPNYSYQPNVVLRSNHKAVKERPNSFSYSEYHKVINKIPMKSRIENEPIDAQWILNEDNNVKFKPILKSYSSEDNLSNSRQEAIDTVDIIGSPSTLNRKNKVRWNIQEKTKKIMNIKPESKLPKYDSLTRLKSNNVHNVKNNVVYAGAGEIIEIKNNQIVNIKRINKPSPVTFKNSGNEISNETTFLGDEICTEL